MSPPWENVTWPQELVVVAPVGIQCNPDDKPDCSIGRWNNGSIAQSSNALWQWRRYVKRGRREKSNPFVDGKRLKKKSYWQKSKPSAEANWIHGPRLNSTSFMAGMFCLHCAVGLKVFVLFDCFLQGSEKKRPQVIRIFACQYRLQILSNETGSGKVLGSP